jgi:ferredoxin
VSRQLTLVVDPVACDGYGACAELFPEWVELDEWGYPMVAPDAIPPDLVGHARRAVAACPKLALVLRRQPAVARGLRPR